MLVQHGADPNVEDKFGQTCLFYAIREGHIEIVDYLMNLDSFTKADKPDKKGLPPYLFAIKHGKNSIAELLATKGVNTQVKAGHDKKSKSKKQKNVENVKSETEEHEKPKRCLLVKITDNGEKVPLSISELEEFRNYYPDVFEMLVNPSLLEEMEKNSPEE
jgi:ankyrin repeat protein